MNRMAYLIIPIETGIVYKVGPGKQNAMISRTVSEVTPSSTHANQLFIRFIKS